RWRPIPIRFLYGLQLRRHLLEQLFIHRPRRVTCRQTLQNSRDAGEDPAVAAAPEQLPAVAVALLEETAVPIEEMFRAVVEVVSGCLDLGVRVLGIALIAGRCSQPDPHRRRHEQGVAPAPAVPALLRCM